MSSAASVAATAASATTPSPAPPALPRGMDVTFYALSLLRRRRLGACIALASHHLHGRPAPSSARATHAGSDGSADDKDDAGSSNSRRGGDVSLASTAGQQLWFIQTRAMVLQSWYKDAELDDDDMGDGADGVSVHEAQGVVSNAHRPATSLRSARHGTSSNNNNNYTMTARGAVARPVSSRYGFARPGMHTGNRPGSRSARGAASSSWQPDRHTAARSSSSRGGSGGAARAISARFARVATATLQSAECGAGAGAGAATHLDVQRLPLAKYARTRPLLAKLLCDYILYVERKPRLALELCYAALAFRQDDDDDDDNDHTDGVVTTSTAPPQRHDGDDVATSAAARHLPPRRLPPTRNNNNNNNSSSSSERDAAVAQGGLAQNEDWYWCARLAKAYYQLNLLRDAETHYKQALFAHSDTATAATSSAAAAAARVPGSHHARRFAHYHTLTVMELGKVYTRLDQPLTALELYRSALQHNPVDHHILLAMARLHEALHEPGKAFDLYRRVCELDSSSVEAIACLAAHCYYERHMPELALRYYRRLLQMGVRDVEVWSNMAVCAYDAEQLDAALDYALAALRACVDDAARADVWYNVGHIAIGLGDVALAQRALRLAVAADDTHAEALNNLAVLLLLPPPPSPDATHEQDDNNSNNNSNNDTTRRPWRRSVHDDVMDVALLQWPHNTTRTTSYDDSDSAQRRRRDGAEELLQLALQAAPDLREPLYNTALLHYHAGRLADAHRLVTHALSVEPGDAACSALHDELQAVLTSPS